jgi:hypothetical protein
MVCLGLLQAVIQDTSTDTTSQYVKIWGASHPKPAFCVGNAIFVKTPQLLSPWHYRPVYKYLTRTNLGVDATKQYNEKCDNNTHALLFWQDDFVSCVDTDFTTTANRFSSNAFYFLGNVGRGH